MNNLLEMLVCPACKSEGSESNLVVADEQALSCPRCASIYPAIGVQSFRILKKDVGKTKETLAAFWGDLYRQLYSETELLNKMELRHQLDLLQDYFKKQRHLAVTEVDLATLAGKVVLEIGSGSGAHSALFRAYGAQVISMDLTPERVVSTQRMVSSVDDGVGDYLCLHADAESIPLRSNSVDMVYSNGVLHHSPRTDKCIAEVHRVLKPGAVSAMMLYCRTSALFFTLWLWQGLLNASRFKRREEEWLGRITEGKPVNQEEFNPVTRVYSHAQLVELLNDFEILSLRKSSFEFGHLLPRGNGLLNKALQSITGKRVHPGGFLVYGENGIVQSGIECWLSRLLGFDWNILVKKGSENSSRPQH
jgi:ubiquinone/menaquinone biosynthesis C-methylase UbiE